MSANDREFVEASYDVTRYADDELIDPNFVAAEVFGRDDIVERHKRLSSIVSHQIVPRLKTLHSRAPELSSVISEEEIDRFAHLVLSPDIRAAEAFMGLLRERGLTTDVLFVELLEPTARHLGEMWNHDECDFVDVTLGLGRLQRLLATFNCTHQNPTMVERRCIFLTAMPGDQHSFGLAMVDKFMRAGGWRVHTERVTDADDLARFVAADWYSILGIAAHDDQQLEELEHMIERVRESARNPAIAVLVGGPAFVDKPHLAKKVGADGTAANAPLAVLAAQKLLDERMLAYERAFR